MSTNSRSRFDEPASEEEALSLICELGHSGEIKVQILYGMYYKKNLDFVALIWEDLAYQIDNIDSNKQDKMFYPRFMKIITHHFLDKDKSISMRNRTFMHTTRDDSLLDTIRFISKHTDTQVYGAIIPKAMKNLALMDSVAYKTYYAISLGAEPTKLRKSQKKSDSAISFEESHSKKMFAKAKKVAATNPKLTKKKAPVKAGRGKGLNVLSKVALYESAQLKKATKRSHKDFHISQASGSGDGTDFESRVLDEQHRKTSGTDEGTSTIPGVPDVPKYDSESKKESWGDNGEEEDDDENDSEDESNNGDNDDDGNDGDGDGDVDVDVDDDANDDDNQEDDETNNDDKETDSDRTESDKIKILVLNQSSTEYYEEEEENINDKETIDEEEDNEVTKELWGKPTKCFSRLGFKQEDEDAHVTLTPVIDTQKTDEPVLSYFVSSDFTSKLLNLENPSPADNEISSLMDTTASHAMAKPVITSIFTITIPPPPLFFNPFPQQATPTPTPTNSESTTVVPALLNFTYVFRFNDRVTNLEKDLSELKQVD
uniref:Uncharacterized protein n=1 Tax=Tanacetum cinerariifolium TaxID=118510 RepID=A0A6L2MEW6_TANCI|nr:hypothetical protein [Tanacetum cinerariifolium]